MTLKMVLNGAVLLAIFYSPYAQIVTGVDTLEMNTIISFRSGAVFYPQARGDYSFQKGFPCSCSVDSADLFFLSHDCGTCLHYCPCEAVGSARSFYISEKSINQLGVENRLDLTDTAIFKKVELNKSCYNQDDSATCFLPSASFRSTQNCRGVEEAKPLIVMTAQNKYVIVRFEKRYGESCDQGTPPPPQCYSYVNALILHWFMQANGTTDFKGIFTETLLSNKRHSDERKNDERIHNFAHEYNAGLFDILGRKVRNLQSKNIRKSRIINHRLFVDEKSNKVMLLF